MSFGLETQFWATNSIKCLPQASLWSPYCFNSTKMCPSLSSASRTLPGSDSKGVKMPNTCFLKLTFQPVWRPNEKLGVSWFRLQAQHNHKGTKGRLPLLQPQPQNISHLWENSGLRKFSVLRVKHPLLQGWMNRFCLDCGPKATELDCLGGYVIVVVVQLLSHVWLCETHGLQYSRLPCPSLSPGVS